ncbi:MAG: lipoprotein [Desulfuromonadaceae bacterium]|nr:lipoprotein [Desulfuromonadaceae bacterium]
MKRFGLLILLGLVLLLSGCECIAGFGRDLQNAGHWIEDTSNHLRE